MSALFGSSASEVAAIRRQQLPWQAENYLIVVVAVVTRGIDAEVVVTAEINVIIR